EAKLGSKHRWVILARLNVARLYQKSGRLGEAIREREQLVKDLRERFGVEHPETLTHLDVLGVMYQDAGTPQLAVPLYEEILRPMKATFGPDDPRTVAVTNNLGLCYWDAGKLDLALPLFQEAAAVIEARGFHHQFAAIAVNNLIKCHEQLQQFDQAEPWRRKWMAVVKERNGQQSNAYADE